jgi:hypothetical protein
MEIIMPMWGCKVANDKGYIQQHGFEASPRAQQGQIPQYELSIS